MEPDYYDTLYSATRKMDKWDFSARIFGVGGGGFSTVDHNLHRMRRAGIAPYFSTANVRRLQPVLDERVNVCVRRLRELKGTGEVVRCVVVASAFSSGEFGCSFEIVICSVLMDE
jgi:cytochrome P450